MEEIYEQIMEGVRENSVIASGEDVRELEKKMDDDINEFFSLDFAKDDE